MAHPPLIKKLCAQCFLFRFLIVFAPIGLLVSGFFYFIGTCQFYARAAKLGPDQLRDGIPSEEAIVVITGDARNEPAALRLLKARKDSLLVISGGASSGFNLDKLIREVWGNAADLASIRSRIITDTKPETTWHVAHSLKNILEKQAVKRVNMVITDIYIPRCLLEFKTVLGEVEVIPYAVSSGFFGLEFKSSEVGILWWEYLKWLLWLGIKGVGIAT